MRYIKDYAITNELVLEESFKEVSEMGREITMADLMKEVNEHYVERGRIKGLHEGKAVGKIEGKAEGIRLMLERLGEKSNILFDLLTDEEKAMIEAKSEKRKTLTLLHYGYDSYLVFPPPKLGRGKIFFCTIQYFFHNALES